jgi:RimJ/RimL family protein N-acetyltransferase
MNLCIRVLSPFEWSALGSHLKRLSADDLRMRFGSMVTDSAIEANLQRLNPMGDAVVAAFSDDLEVIGSVLITRDDAAAVEMSVSVDEGFRGQGIGTALMTRAFTWARNRGYRLATVRCLSENVRMLRLARRCGMKVEKDFGDAEGATPIEPPTLVSPFLEWTEECAAFAKYSMLAARAATRWYAPPLAPQSA